MSSKCQPVLPRHNSKGGSPSDIGGTSLDTIKTTPRPPPPSENLRLRRKRRPTRHLVSRVHPIGVAELFAGKGLLAQSFTASGSKVHPYDFFDADGSLLAHGELVDPKMISNINLIFTLIKAGRSKYLHLAVPCVSFSIQKFVFGGGGRGGGGRGPLRGLRGMGDTSRTCTEIVWRSMRPLLYGRAYHTIGLRSLRISGRHFCLSLAVFEQF